MLLPPFLTASVTILLCTPLWKDSQVLEALRTSAYRVFSVLPRENRSIGFPTFIGASFTNTTGMTIELCVNFCSSQSYILAGLESGCTCYCDNFYENILESVGNNECDVPCAGNYTESCGASDRVSVYHAPGGNLAVPTFVPSVGLWKGLGCYNDSTSARALERRIDAGNVTVESCTAACLAETFPFAGLEFGQECWCGLQLDNNAVFYGTDYNGIEYGEFREDPNGDYCNMGCEGNSSELCGGSSMLDVYQYTGTFPAGASVVPFSGAWISQGCFSDSTSQRTLERRVDAGNVTVESCTAECQSESFDTGFTVAGLEFGQECWCGTQIAPGLSLPQSACDQACVGNSSEVCGGPNALEVYVFQNSPQVVGDLQELIGLTDSLADFITAITAANVQTTGPEMLVGFQGIVNTASATIQDASNATNEQAGKSPFISNNADVVTDRLIDNVFSTNVCTTISNEQKRVDSKRSLQSLAVALTNNKNVLNNGGFGPSTATAIANLLAAFEIMRLSRLPGIAQYTARTSMTSDMIVGLSSCKIKINTWERSSTRPRLPPVRTRRCTAPVTVQPLCQLSLLYHALARTSVGFSKAEMAGMAVKHSRQQQIFPPFPGRSWARTSYAFRMHTGAMSTTSLRRPDGKKKSAIIQGVMGKR
ncbi:WSC-domain-containing protein [Artomyces pyxidatus]|uniref:WSC-domain-containing protein n=1 Tax=Artomyces pyxidatus TaxID=48021 RepID=A0ACB8TAU2_9AGAM|nr:WSC-domain-containing protein [Artomyces pyxidatus]